MKKILLFLLIIIFAACQKQIVPVKSRNASVSLTDVNIGSAPNDGTGDPLRTAFGKINANNALIESAIATLYTAAETDQAITDATDGLIAAAEYGVALADSNITTEGGYLSGYDSKTVGIRQSDLPLGENDTINFVYYVSEDGDDDNDGLSPGSSWAHHPWMSTWTGSVTLEAGDVVCMKRGDSWTIASPAANYMIAGQSGSSHKYITTTAYGVGTKPLIKITTDTEKSVINADAKSFLIFDNLHIQHHSSTYDSDLHKHGIHLENECHDIIVTNCEIDDIPCFCIWVDDNGYNIAIGDTLATTTATEDLYSNHLHDFGYTGIGFEGSQTGGNYSNFKAYYNYVHGSTRTGTTELAYGIYFSANTSSNDWPHYAYCRYNRVEDIQSWEALDMHGGSHIYFQDNYVHNFGGFGIMAGGSTQAGLDDTYDTIYIERNIIEQTEGEWVTGDEGGFIVAYVSEDDYWGEDIYIRDNTLFYTERPTGTNNFEGIYMRNLDGVEISGNIIYNGCTTSSQNDRAILTCAYGNGIKNVTISDNYISQWGEGITIVGEFIVGEVIIRNNVVTDLSGNYGCIRFRISDLPATADLQIYNNTLIAHISYVIRSSIGTTAGGSLEIKNNILGFNIEESPTAYFIYWDGTVSGTFSCDYNQYWHNTDPNCFYWGGSARNWAYWTTTLSYDTNSPNFGHGDSDYDPLFKNINGDYSAIIDFDLQTTSPCINAGVDVAIDYLGTAPDIGYIEKR